MPSGSRFPPQPGAQAAIQFASFSESDDAAPSPAGRPVPPKHDQPGPELFAVEALGRCDLARRDAEQDHVMDDLRLARVDANGRDRAVARLLRVEQEAAVVVRDALCAPTVGTSPACGGSAASLRNAPPGLVGAAGLRAGPSTFPPLVAHATIAARSSAVSVRDACPAYAGERLPGGHGGMTRACTAAPMSDARAEICFAVSSGNGAMPPVW